MAQILVSLLASLMLITLTGCSDHSHEDGSHSHETPEHHDTIK